MSPAPESNLDPRQDNSIPYSTTFDTPLYSASTPLLFFSLFCSFTSKMLRSISSITSPANRGNQYFARQVPIDDTEYEFGVVAASAPAFCEELSVLLLFSRNAPSLHQSKPGFPSLGSEAEDPKRMLVRTGWFRHEEIVAANK
jgi:hypothetical protein